MDLPTFRELGLHSIEEGALIYGIIGGLITVLVVFALIYCTLMIVAEWKIFEKAGEKGWKSLIPIYNQYIMFKIVGMKNWFWISICVSVLVSVIVSAMGFNTDDITKNDFNGTNLFASLIYFAMVIFTFVITVMNYYRIAKVFGHGCGYTVGLVFITSIMLLVLGFGSDKYDKKIAKDWGVETK